MSEANSNTLSPEQQMEMGGRFRQAKTGSGEGDAAEEAGEDGQPKSLREKVMGEKQKGVFQSTAESFREIAKKQSKTEAIKQGILIGLDLRKRISEEQLDSETFIMILFLSLIKDFTDFVDMTTMGTIGALFNIVISIILFIIFFLKGSILRKFLIKKFIWPIIIEFIPGLNIFPSYTVSAILLKLKADKKIKKLENEFKIVNKEVEKLKKHGSNA